MSESALLWLVLGVTLGGFITWLFLGGKFKVSKDGFEFETEGLLRYLREAASSKGAATPNEMIVRQELKARVIGRQLPTLKVLWVDDNPTGNLYERLALAAIGIFVDSYTNNRDAASVLQVGGFDLVISDLQRSTERETGWDLLSELRAVRPDLPFVFYVGHIDDAIVERSRKLKAEVTNDPTRLVQLVVARIT